MTLSPAFLDEVRARTPLSALIGRKVKLTKAGREQKGCCPFHGEKTPSFYVNDDKAFYHCFGCSAHGDAIRWLTDHEGMPFIDAVKELAAAAGLEMPDRDPRHADRDRERTEMLEIMDRAARFYAGELRGTASGAALARDYVVERGLADQRESFGLGYAAGGLSLRNHLRDVSTERLAALGLVRVSEQGEVRDFFRRRLMFPIHDARGRVIAFGGRVLDGGQPKYLNSPDTPIFDKGASLYNQHRAAPAARAKNRLLLVEGYMDTTGVSHAGVTEAVAPNGTALTEAQIALAWRMADNPICCFDGDPAGSRAAARAALRALPMLEPGKSLSFATPPEGQDPDDVARQGGARALETMLAGALPLVEVLWRYERAAMTSQTPEQVAGLTARLREHVRSIRNSDVREAYGNDLALRLQQLQQPAPRGPRPNRSTERRSFGAPPPPRQSERSKAIARGGIREQLELAVLAGLLLYPDVARQESEATAFAKFRVQGGAALRDAILDAALERRELTLDATLERAAALARASTLPFSFVRFGHDPKRAAADLADALYQLRH